MEGRISKRERNRLRKVIREVGTEMEWRMMSREDLENNIVNPLQALTENDLGVVVNRLEVEPFDLLMRKLWQEQDVPPWNNGYEDTMHLMVLIKRLLIVRLTLEAEATVRRSWLTRQLAQISLILDPIGLAVRTGMPLDGEACGEVDNYDDVDDRKY